MNRITSWAFALCAALLCSTANATTIGDGAMAFGNAGGGGGGGGGITGSGTTDRITVWTGASTVGSLGAGTLTTVLHGNPSGLPGYSAVVLTTDVSGILPIANGGTGSATQNFVDLTTAQASIAGEKTFTARLQASPHANSVGLRLPTFAGAPSAVTGTVEGDVVWDSTGNALYCYDGAAFVACNSGGGGSGLTVGTTSISSGTTGRVLLDVAGVLQESASLNFAAATGLGVGPQSTPTSGIILDVWKDQNALTRARIKNTTAGTGSAAELLVVSDASAGTLVAGVSSSSYTPTTAIGANDAYFLANGVNSLNIGTVSSAPVEFYVNGVQSTVISAAGTGFTFTSNGTGEMAAAVAGASNYVNINAYNSTTANNIFMTAYGSTAAGTTAGIANGGTSQLTMTPVANAAIISVPTNDQPLVFATQSGGTLSESVRFASTANHRVEVSGGTLATGKRALKVTATQINNTSAQIGVHFDITGAGSGTTGHIAQYVSYNAGYLGAAAAVSIYGENTNASTGVLSTDLFTGNFGTYGTTVSTTTGSNIGAHGDAAGGDINVGAESIAITAKNSAKNLGALMLARNTGTSPVEIGAFAGLYAALPPLGNSAALVADNGAVAADIFSARDNGTAVFTIANGGAVSVGTSIDIGGGTAIAAESFGTCTLDGAATATCTGTVVSGANNCTCSDNSPSTLGVAAMACSVSGTTVTVTSATTLDTSTVTFDCKKP